MSACGVKVEGGSGSTTPPNVVPTASQLLEAQIAKNQMIGHQYKNPAASILIQSDGTTELSVHRTCDIGAQLCNFIGQPVSDAFVVDAGSSTSNYAEKLENGQNMTVSMTADAQTVTLNEVVTANNVVVSAITHVLTQSATPCGDGSHGVGLEDQSKIKSYFDGGSSDSASCQALYLVSP